MARPPTRPLLVLLRRSTTYYVTLVSPKDNQLDFTSGEGPHEVIGKLKDKGYEFGIIKHNIPQWVIEKLPMEYIVMGFADINGFPIK